MCWCAGALQVMEEGEVLSRKQLTQEGTIRKLRASVREAGEARATLEHTLASDQARLQEALSARATLDDSRRVRRPPPPPPLSVARPDAGAQSASGRYVGLWSVQQTFDT